MSNLAEALRAGIHVGLGAALCLSAACIEACSNLAVRTYQPISACVFKSCTPQFSENKP